MLIAASTYEGEQGFQLMEKSGPLSCNYRYRVQSAAKAGTTPLVWSTLVHLVLEGAGLRSMRVSTGVSHA
jgi:hypothetical protein